MSQSNRGAQSPIHTECASITIRDCAELDMPSVHAIYAHQVLTGTASFEITPPTLNEMIARRDAILAHPGPYLVAVADAVVVGYAYAGCYRTRHAYRFTVENTVYVAEAAARRGIGLALMDAVIERSQALGYHQMIAVIGGDNAASVALHARAGFHLVGIHKSVGHKFGQWLGSTIMQRALNAGPVTPGVQK